MTAATIDADLPPELEGAVAQRLERAHSERVVERIRSHDGTLWAPEGTPEVTDRLGWLDIAERMASELDDLDASPRRSAPRATPTPCCSAWAARASRPRSSGARSARGDGLLTLHVLDSTAPGADRARCIDAHRPREDAVHRLLEVGRDDRDDLAVQVLPRAASPTARTSSRSPTRARASRSSRAEHGFRRVVRRRPGHRRALLGAVLLRARPGRARRRRRRRACSRPAHGAAAGLRAAEATPACGSAARSASWRAPGATS